MAAHFTPESMRFLRGLIKNNDRTWFEERRSTYERALKQPMQGLIEQINLGLDEIAPEHVRPAHKIAKRIYRDTRFSPDKRPYKRHLEAWWARRGLEKRSGAGFFLRVGPLGSFVAAGVYDPEREDLLALRRWLAEHHERYRGVLKALLRAKGKSPAMDPLTPAPLTRNPKGFAPDHPASDLLRARNWGVMLPIAPEAILSEALPELVLAHFRRAAELVNVLNEPLLGMDVKSSTQALF